MRYPLRWLSLTVLAVAAAPLAAQPAADAPRPPVAKPVPWTATAHGDTRTDPYHWLREKTNPEVIAHLEAENAYSTSVLKHTDPLREKLYQEMVGRIKQTDLSVPVKNGGYFYYSRTEQGKQYPIVCRKPGGLDAPEQVMLDGNEMAKGQKFFSLGAQHVSDDGNLLAYTTDTTGFREYHLFVKDLRTGEVLPDRLGKVASAAWAADNQTLFYVTEDAAKRPHRLYRHALGTPKDQDELIYDEKDELFRLFVRRSHDKKYLFAVSGSTTSDEVRYLPSDRPGGAFTVVLPREPDHEYGVDHRDGLFYIRTNKGAKNFKLVTAPVTDPKPANWTELVPHRPEVLFEGQTLFKDYAVFTEREQGLPHLAVHDFRAGRTKRMNFPEPVYSVFPTENPEFDTTAFRFRYDSLVTPDSVYEYDLAGGGRKLLKRTEVLGGYDPAQYQSERVWATASDGTKVPIALVYKKGVKRDGSAPLLLYGYGSYGATMGATFNSARLSLLDRGFVYAQASIRGGSDLGRAWYEQGKLMKKKNTFTDFIACADHLVAQKYTSRDRLAIHGGSAGGLLIGAVLNFRPDVCKAAVLEVPFVDVVNTMLDPTLPLTVQEYLEWGNPNVKEEYEYIKSYCPYTNLAAKDYPAMLVRTSLNDSQVMYWEPAKYVAKLRTLRTDHNPLLLTVNMAGGHGGSSGRYDRLKEVSLTYAFILDQMGVKE
jgi:oligopeptidase B